MPTMRRRLARRRTDLRWVFVVAAFFVFLFTLTWERIAHRETSGRLERLEMQLQSLETDEAMLRTQLKQQCRFTEVQQIASREWGMAVAVPEQRIRLASATKRTVLQTASTEPSRSAVERLTQVFRGGVAQAQPATGGEGNGTQGR